MVSENGEQKIYKINFVLLDNNAVEEKSNNTLPLVIIGIETIIIGGMLITGFVLNKKGRLVITK